MNGSLTDPPLLVRLQHKATHVTVICTSCKNTRVIPCKPGLGGAAIPRTCTAAAESEMGDAQCGLDPFVILPHKSNFVDQQTLKLQASACLVFAGDVNAQRAGFTTLLAWHAIQQDRRSHLTVEP